MNPLLLQLFFTVLWAGQNFTNEQIPFRQKVTLDPLACYETNGNNDYDCKIIGFLPGQDKELVFLQTDWHEKLNLKAGEEKRFIIKNN